MKKAIKLVIFIIIGCLLLAVFDYHCLIDRVFGISCPTCGMTRAILALFLGDISGYLQNNAMALPVMIAAIILIFYSVFNKKNKLLLAICIIILLINLVYYFWRFYTGTII